MKRPGNKVRIVQKGLRARVQVLLLQLTAATLARLDYRFMWHACHILGRWLKSDSTAVLELQDGTSLQIWLNDSYWLFLLRNDATYEPEVDFVLRSQLTPNSYFVDAGANIGYWSAKAARLIGDPGHVVAIEASPPTYHRLTINAALDGTTRFDTVNRAVWSADNAALSIMTREDEHAGATVVPSFRPNTPVQSVRQDPVLSVTIDSVVASLMMPRDEALMIKLDVEGAERVALEGASETLRSRDVLIIYEDHGADPASLNTTYMLTDLALLVFYIDPRTLRPTRIDSIELLRSIKVNQWRGYNFLATQPSSRYAVWLTRLLADRPPQSIDPFRAHA